MTTNKRWDELTDRQQKSIIVLAGVELIITTVALIDLARRPAEQVRGPKALWALGCFIQPIGPIAYLAGGRR